MGVFGDKLRQQRERRGITLDAVANTTKISTRMLKALEDEHFDQLPGGVFNKGFVRAYARQVGLDEEEAINDYLAALAESQVQSQPIVPNFRAGSANSVTESPASKAAPRSKSSKDLTRDRRTHSDRRVEPRRTEDRFQEDPVLKLGSLRNPPEAEHVKNKNEDLRNEIRHDRTRPIQEEEDLIARLRQDSLSAEPFHEPKTHSPGHAAIADDGNRVERDSDEHIPASPPSFLNLSAPPQPAGEEPQLEPSPDNRGTHQPIHWRAIAIPLFLLFLVIAFWGLYRSNHPHQRSASSGQTAPPSPTPTAASLPEKPSPTANAAAAPVPTPQPAQPAAPPEKPASDVTKMTPAHTEPLKPKPLPAFTLVIRASENSWVAITADGQPVAQETLIAPANTSVRATREITVKTGNAAGVSFLLNGKDIPASGGGEGEVHTYTFDANGLRDAVAAPAANPTN